MDNTPDKKLIHEHVIQHIDDAIANNWIKVYYQPVIRALTGQLCSAESLARWIDPELGFLAPDMFIGALEESQNIHKLDCFIVEQVCRDIHEHLISGKPTFPVSVNFSRLDFIMCDMLKVVETATSKYNVPRDFIHFEITESMIAQDEELMKDIIEKFRNRGYEIWMDDFGSGYSSLTLLQDYEFDLLKLDMHFLFTMTDKSKTIVRSTINMSKNIGIKTLCEGVETKEQIDFLYSIGCGKFQGYYFDKPQPYDDMLKTMEEKNIKIEERKWHNYYEIASISALDLEHPLEIVEYDGNSFHTLFMNDAFKRQISLNDKTTDEIDNIIFNKYSALVPKYKQFAEKAIASKSIESFYYTDMGNYYQLKVLYLAENENKYLFKAAITNISLEQNTKERDRLDSRLRELNHLHEVVLLLNYKENVIYPLLGGYIYADNLNENSDSLRQACKSFSELYIFPEDQLSFIDFMQTDVPVQRIIKDGQSFSKNVFRVKQKNGAYKWREFALVPIVGTDGTEFLFTISIIPEEVEQALNDKHSLAIARQDSKVDEQLTEYARLWYTLLNNSSHKFFWKDKDRRFRGVSKSFLDFYEIKSLDDIIGKTDEEMHWHVDDGPYQGDELDVIGNGKIVYNAPGQCIVNGVLRNIICNKLPIYENGEIIGLVGNFEDIDEEVFRIQRLMNPTKIDNLTRLMNNKYFMLTMMDYATQYADEGRNYAFILLHNVNHHRIEDTYGSNISASVLRAISDKIIDVTGQTAVASRLKEAYFGILTYLDSKEKLEKLTLKLKEHIEEINQVNGQSVTIKINTACHLRSEDGMNDEALYAKCLKDIEQIEKSSEDN